MICVCTSDLHGNLPPIPDSDLLIIAGDICPFGDHIVQLRFLNMYFRNWLEALKARNITVIGIAGNHDTIFAEQPYLVPELPWTYLQDSGTSYNSYTIWGTPWSLPYGWWPFMTDEEHLGRLYAGIPENVDILISHGPPYGYGDLVQTEDLELIYAGSKALLKRIQEVKPKLCVFGHIHEGRGLYNLGETLLANVTLVDKGTRPVHSPAIFGDL